MFFGFSLLILWLQLSWVTSQKKVEQNPPSLTVQEGEDAIVNCVYTDTAFSYFFCTVPSTSWQRSSVGRTNEYLVTQLKDHLMLGERVPLTLNCTYNARDSTGKKVTQLQSMTGREGEAVTLSCKYDTSESNYALFWYKQLPSREMIFLIRQDSYNQQNAREDRYLVNFQKINRSITFTILASQLQDSAIYFCVLCIGTVRRVIRGTIRKYQHTPYHCHLLHKPHEETYHPRQEGAGTGAPQLGGALETNMLLPVMKQQEGHLL